MGMMEGRDSRHIAQRYRDLYKPALLANWQVWPLAQVSYAFEMVSLTSLTCVLVDKLPLYALAVSCSIPVHVRRFLDLVPFLAECEVRIIPPLQHRALY